MAELSARSGVPAPTIRFYLREGLLEPGRLTSPNQAVYDHSHVRRLRLVKALLEIGGLSVEAARAVITAMEAKAGNDFAVIGQVQYGLSPTRRGGSSAGFDDALDAVEALISRRGWQVRENNPARRSLAEALSTLQAIGRSELLSAIDDYADAAETLARREVEELLSIDGEEVRAEAVIAVTVLGDALISALRRLAQEAVLSRRMNSSGESVT
jgi:DNA-binding transcriptional MerR regulator